MPTFNQQDTLPGFTSQVDQIVDELNHFTIASGDDDHIRFRATLQGDLEIILRIVLPDDMKEVK